jgi:hypothetical protein
VETVVWGCKKRRFNAECAGRHVVRLLPPMGDFSGVAILAGDPTGTIDDACAAAVRKPFLTTQVLAARLRKDEHLTYSVAVLSGLSVMAGSALPAPGIPVRTPGGGYAGAPAPLHLNL